MTRSALALFASLLPACVFCDWDDHDEGWGHPPPGSDGAPIDACEGAPEVQFPAAICVCDTFSMLGNFEARGLGDHGATVGVNGHARFFSNAEIDGTLYTQGGLDADGNGEIRGDVISTGSLSWFGNLEIGGDLNVGGDLVGLGNLEVEGDLRLGGSDRGLGNVEVGGHGPYVTPAQAPCPCDPSTFFDVTAAVAAAATEPSIAALPTALKGNADLRLESGSYYVHDATWLGNLALLIDGHVDLFIDDSLATLGNGEIELTAGSTLDVYIAGSLQTLGNHWIGGGVPGTVRVYVGGDDGVMLNAGNTEFMASIYAPTAEVAYLGNAEIHGAIFARTLRVEGNFEVAYPELLDAPDPRRCRPQPDDEPDDGPSDGPDGEPDGGDDAPAGTTGGGNDGGDEGPHRDTEPGGDDDAGTGGDEPGTGGDEPGTGGDDDAGTGGDDPGTTGGDECPEVQNDCYDIEDKFVCIETTGCKWKHGFEYCTWQVCGGLDQTMCGLDPACAWNECTEACYPSA